MRAPAPPLRAPLGAARDPGLATGVSCSRLASGGAPHDGARGRRTSFAPGLARRAALALGLVAATLTAAPATAQPAGPATAVATVARTPRVEGDTLDLDPVTVRPTVPVVSRFRSMRDSVAWERTRTAAERASGLHVVVLLEERQLAVMRDADTLMVAPIAIGMDTTISFGARSWTFETPRGRRTVQRKEKDPVWVPPEWHYAEVAGKRGLALAHLSANRAVRLADGRKLVMRGGRAGLVDGTGSFTALPTDEEIVFDGTLYVPPLGSHNRRIPGELGRFKLDLGNGYLLHGTPHEDTIGDAATHGCVRLYDEDIEWLYRNVPVGTAVFIY